MNDPELVFLDEMTTGLDPAARHIAWDLVRAVRDAGTSVVLVTHFMEEAERLCDRVLVDHRPQERRMSLRALQTSAWIEAKLFVREPMTVAFTLVLPLLFLFVLGGVFGNTPSAKVYGEHGPLDFYVPTYIGLVWASVGLLALPVHLARYREDGVLRRLRASAAPRWAVFGSQAIVASAIALAGGALVIAAAALAYHIHPPRVPAGVLAAWLLAGVVFSCLGILLSCIPTSRGALGAGLGLFFVMMMLSGAGPRSR